MPEFIGRLRTPRLASPPSSPVPGEVYYDTILGQLLFWDGLKWSQGPQNQVYDSDYVGTVKAFAGPAIPTNWMLCDGRSLPTADYPELFTAIGYKHGGSGANFNLPDLRQKFIYGVAQADLSDLGVGGGAATVTLTAGQMPSHNHGGVTGTDSPDHSHAGSTNAGDGNHYHESDTANGPYAFNKGGATFSHSTGGNTKLNITSVDSLVYPSPAGSSFPTAHIHGLTTGGASARHAHSIATSGADQAHENLPPYIRLVQIIKVTGAQINAGGALVGPQGPKGDPGPWRGAWSAATAYNVGDSVSYFDGTVTGSYRRKVAGTTAGNPKTDTTNWELIASGGSVGADGAPGTVPVFEQANDPGAQPVGAIWIDTDDVAPIYVGVPLVSVLPSNPVDGQEVMLLVDATTGVIWHLRYRASSSSSYKWEFVGGPPLVATTPDYDSISGAGFAPAAHDGPKVTLPRPGDYVASFNADIRPPANVFAGMGVAWPGSGPTNDEAIWAAGGTGGYGTATNAATIRRNSVAAGVVTMHYFSQAGTALMGRRWLSIIPVRVS